MAEGPLIVWSDPPPRKSGGTADSRYVEHVKLLRERPGEWACVMRHPNARMAHLAAAAIREDRIYARIAHPGRFEVVKRQAPGGDHGVWVRWVAPKVGEGKA